MTRNNNAEIRRTLSPLEMRLLLLAVRQAQEISDADTDRWMDLTSDDLLSDVCQSVGLALTPTLRETILSKLR